MAKLLSDDDIFGSAAGEAQQPRLLSDEELFTEDTPAADNWDARIAAQNAELERDRTWGEVRSDLGSALMEGFARFGSGLNEITRYTPGGLLQTRLDEAFGTGTVADVIEDTVFAPAKQSWNEAVTPQLQHMREKLGEAEGLGGTVGALAEDPALIADVGVQQLPALLAQLGLVGKIAPAKQALMGMLMEGVQAGGESGVSIRETMAQIPEDALLANSPEYRQLVQEVGPERARERLTNSLAAQGTATSAAVTALLSRLMGDTSRLQKALAGDAVGGLSGFARRQLAEGVSEGVQEAAEGASTDFALQRADQRIDPLDTDARMKDAVLGAVLGFTQGTGVEGVRTLRARVRSQLEAQGVDTSQLSDEQLDAEIERYVGAAEEASRSATPEEVQAAVEQSTGTGVDAPLEGDARDRRGAQLASVFLEDAPVQRRDNLEIDPETGEARIPEDAEPLRNRAGTPVRTEELANNRQAETLLREQGLPADQGSVRTMALYLERGLSPREALNAFTRAARSGEFRDVPLEREGTQRQRREQFAGEAFELADRRRQQYEQDGARDRFPRDARPGASPADLQPGVAPSDPRNPWVPSQAGIQAAQAEGRITPQEASQLADLRDYVDAGFISEQEAEARAKQVLYPDQAPSNRMRQDLEQDSRRVPQGVNEGQPGQPRNSVDRISTTQPGGLQGEYQQPAPAPEQPSGPTSQGRDVTQPGPGLENRMAPTADEQRNPRLTNQGAATADNQRPDQSRRAPVRVGEQVTAYREDGTPVQVTVDDVQDNGDVRVRHSDGSTQMIGDRISLQRPQNQEPGSPAGPDSRQGSTVAAAENADTEGTPVAGRGEAPAFRSSEQQAQNLKTGRELIDQQLQNKPLAAMGLTPEQWDAVVNEITERQTDAVTGWLDARGGTMKHDAFLAARDAARETGKPVVFVGMDIANLGGLNAHYNDVAADANREYRAITDIVLERLASLGYTLEIRTGGDELGVFIHNVTEAEAQDAMDAASAAVIDHAQAQGYGDIMHGKTKEPGFGVKVHWATVPVNVDSTDSSVYSEADRRMKQKPTGDDNAATQQPESPAPQPGPPDAAAAEPAAEPGRQDGGDVLPAGEAEAGAPSLAKVPKKLLRLVDDYGDPRSIPLERIPEAQRQLLRDLGLVRTSRAVEGEREIVFTNVLFDEMRRRGMEPTGPSLLARPGLEDRLAVTDKQLDDMSPTRLEFLGERMGFPPRITQNYDTLLNTLKNEHPDDIEAALEQLAEDEAEAAAEAEERARNRGAADRANEARQRVTTPEGLTYDAGSDGTVLTPNGQEIEYTWALVDSADLVVSNDAETGNVNPSYPAELQPRDRSRAASQDQVRRMAANLEPRLLQDSNTTAEGAPIVGPDGVVESGNGRMMAIQRGDYDASMMSLKDKGLAGTNAAGKVLVRVRKTPMSPQERLSFVRNSNERTTMGMSAAEQAKADADSITPIISQYQGGDVTSPLNREFVRAFMLRAVSPEEQATFLQENGTVSADGRRRMQAAIFQAAYGDANLVSEIFESTDTDIKAIGNALLDAAGWWGDMRQSVTQAGGNPDMDLTENLLEAVRLVQQARQSRQSLKEVLDQGDLMSGEVGPMTRKMVEVLYQAPNLKRARSQKVVARALSEYAMDASQRGASVDMFGEVSPEQLLNQALENAQSYVRRGEQGDLLDGGGEPDTQGPRAQVNVKFYSGLPLDALTAAIKKVIAAEKAHLEFAAEQLGQLIEQAQEALKGLRGKDRLTKGSILADMWRVTFATLDGDLRILADRFNSPTLSGLADKFHATAGSDAGVGQTFDEATQARNKRLQIVDQIVSLMRDAKMTKPEQQRQIIRLVENPKTPRRGFMGETADRIDQFLREELKYLREAGVELGEVRDGYFPREMDSGKVAMKEDLFIQKATLAYQEMGLDQEAAQEAARAYWESIVYGSSGKPGATRPASQTPKFTQSRIFTKEAARHLEQFRLTDIDAVLGQYVMRATKRAEIARRFGDNWSKWNEIEKQILAEDPEAQSILPAIRDRVALSAGVRIDGTSHAARTGLSMLRTWTTLATLAKSAMPSIGELVMAPIRGTTGNIPQDLAASLGNILLHGKNMARWMTGMDRSEATQALFELAEDIGIIAGTGHNSLMAARFAGGDPVGKIQSTVLAEFFKRNLLEYLTNYTRVTSMRMGQTFIRRLAHQMQNNPKKAGVFLRELGVPRGQEKAFADWVNGLGPDLPGVKDIKGPYAKVYRNALQRFTDQTVMRPSASTRPKWASHPLGAVLFQLQAFGYAFQKNVLNRTVRVGMNQELSAMERVAFTASTLSGFALLAMLQGLIRYWRDEVYNPEINDRKTDWAFVEGSLSQAGLFGVADPYMQSLSGVRYQKNPAQMFLGPALGGVTDASGDFIAAMLANSPNTNTAERNLAKSAYDWMLEPIMQSLLTVMPGGPITGKAGSFMTVYAVPAGRDPFADMVAGEKEASNRNPPIMGALEFLLNGAKSGGSEGGRGTRETTRSSSRSGTRESSR